jgi:hypothetical protein
MTIPEEVRALQQLHALQGYLVIGSVKPLPTGPIDLKLYSNDEAYLQARWSVMGESCRSDFEAQARCAFGRGSGLGCMLYFYRVYALD